MKMTKGEFIELMRDEGYSFNELVYLFREICKMDKKVRHWVLRWLCGQGYPTDVIEEVTVAELVEKQGLKPLNAFIVMDWLIKDPDAAKYSLTRPHMPLDIDDETRIQIMEQVKPTYSSVEDNDVDKAAQSEETIED